MKENLKYEEKTHNEPSRREQVSQGSWMSSLSIPEVYAHVISFIVRDTAVDVGPQESSWVKMYLHQAMLAVRLFHFALHPLITLLETHLESLLEDLGLKQNYTEKLSLSSILQIDKKIITDEPAKCNSDLPWYFLKTLMMVNVTARNVKCGINPLDLITDLFLCSDGFVQQEMSLKMSMCQFSVPLLLPNCDTQQCTLMLWAMRDIVKKYRPQSLSESKGFMEDRIVLSELPMISFERLGECCSFSKSEILNKLLSNSQQHHDTFVHRNMDCGDSPRKISNGLTEITWSLPCGNKNMDVFSEPVAVANLHGDITSFETQYSFLCQKSAAVFVFFDKLEPEFKLLNSQHHKAQILRVRRKMRQNLMKMRIEQTADIAHELGIMVDEDYTECQDAKKNADGITVKIQDILTYKEAQRPLQGQIWKELTNLEKEEFRLRKVDFKNIETYKSDLNIQKRELRKKQNSYYMSDAMMCFIKAISSPGIERCYFLKWMRMNLDNPSRDKLSGLREQYKKKCNSENKEEIKDIDRQLSNSSLGTEHFFREMGQMYEASLSLPETHLSRQQLEHLPKLCAGLMIDGFPLELVDRDASNIPLRWVSDVLSQLHELVSPKNKILVVTVLGVQSTGKSTLLNTMFGMQFTVSSGRCTRALNSDFMVIIDTEGLKSPELAQLDDSHEHDNELATFVVGSSDITIINIAMENSIEMKDILQIVVHAFLRMKAVGKKPKCQFKNLRDRKLLLQQLNEMTQAAAKMEKKEDYKSFTDVMEYNPDTGNWYIPGLWNGNPPMAPVNAGYSKARVDEKSKTRISNFGTVAATSAKSELRELLRCLKTEASTFLAEWETKLLNNLTDYFKQTEGHVYLVEGYREEFSNSAKSIRREIEKSVFNQLTAAAEIKQGMREVDQIKVNHTKEMEKAVCALIDECRKKKVQMTEKELDKEFGKMWNGTVRKLSFSAQKASHVFTTVSFYLRQNLSHKGSEACELFSKKTDSIYGQVSKWLKLQDYTVMVQTLVDSIIDACTQAVTEKMERKNNYHDTYIQEILLIIDERLQNKHVKTNIKFEVSLKQHICGFAARNFQQMYEDFLQLNDPYTCLSQNKEKFHADFKAVFHERDQCQKKAEEFTNQCLKPAVEDFINRSLGPDIIGQMLTLQQFSTRIWFQYSLLQDLLLKDTFGFHFFL
ncbi:hypothetical protein Q8A73_002814 [Channa argus]|nr:hypothetical protein Q8A73_002814 [Channa argus]